MGRKSRRNMDIAPVASVQRVDIFPAAIYARLSVENSGKDDDGAAIENQIDVCKEYISDTPDLQLVKIYQDNGWTGTNMNRPSFDAMMEEVRSGRIRAIVVRDLSRFGRNYLETGTYLERVFPRLDVRFISVKERLDTFRNDGSAESLMIPLQNLINELYAKDISRKIHAVFKVKREEKSFKWSTAPFGYQWNEDHTAFITVPEEADTVREIYRKYLDGIGVQRIADALNDNGIPTSSRKRQGRNTLWAASVVSFILRNPVYTGILAWGRSRSELYRNCVRPHTSRDEWVVKEDAHEAIIAADVYDEVQMLMDRAGEKARMALERTADLRKECRDFFKGRIFCGDCGNPMYFTASVAYNNKAYGRYTCGADEFKKNGCSTHALSKIKLDSKVLNVIYSQMDLALDYDKMLEKLRNSEFRRNREQELKRNIKVISGRIKTMQDRRKRLYEDYADGILDAQEYMLAKDTYEKKAEKLSGAYEKAVDVLKVFNECINGQNKWVSMLRDQKRSKILTKELVDSVIERIYVFEGAGVEVVMKHQDIFDHTKEIIEKGGAMDE